MKKTQKRPTPRRTQQERREATIDKLLRAGSDVLVKEGYAAASIQAICARAGLSQGGLFRHFATREALMVAIGRDLAERMLTQYRSEFARRSVGAKGDVTAEITLALQLVRKRCRSPLNQAWYELMLAARTQPPLRRALAPVARRYYADIESLAASLLPAQARTFGPSFGPLVHTIVAMFDGETLQRGLWRKAEIEDARVPLVAALVAGAAGGKRS